MSKSNNLLNWLKSRNFCFCNESEKKKFRTNTLENARVPKSHG